MKNINAIHPDISFTWRPFLDVMIERRPEEGQLIFSSYRKEYAVVVPPVWTSFHSYPQKVAILDGYFHWALRRNMFY
jgi:hypothetical protein